ncbi:MAG: hypothetical protein K5764_10555 [Prevotella sp.]|nr:hypothetical protein [Prevotella sp.]
MNSNKMKTENRELAPIPISFVVEQGQCEHTEAKRRPYRKLITTWAEHEGLSELGEAAAGQLNLGKEPERLKDLRDLPNCVAPKYRKGEKAERLVLTVREINARVENDSNWTWALVMKVMLDEGLLIVNIPNKFDRLVCQMVPGKGIDTVRKNGDYNIVKSKRSWHQWIENAGVDWEEAANRAICEEIYELFKPLFTM